MDIKDFYRVCINLKDRPDRWSESLREFSRVNIDVARVNGLKKENPIIGCAASHFNVLDFCKDIDRHAMIFEDDVQFTKEFSIQDYLDELDTVDWDMLYLGANITSPIYQVSDKLGRLTSAQSTHAYLVNKSFIPKVLACQNFLGKHMDLIYSENIIPHNNCFITIPLLAIQRPSYSDIEMKFVDYSWMHDRYRMHLVKKG